MEPFLPIEMLAKDRQHMERNCRHWRLALFTSPESVFPSSRNPYSHRAVTLIHMSRNMHSAADTLRLRAPAWSKTDSDGDPLEV